MGVEFVAKTRPDGADGGPSALETSAPLAAVNARVHPLDDGSRTTAEGRRGLER